MAHRRRQTAGDRLDLGRDLRVDRRCAETGDIEDFAQSSLATSARARWPSEIEEVPREVEAVSAREDNRQEQEGRSPISEGSRPALSKTLAHTPAVERLADVWIAVASVRSDARPSRHPSRRFQDLPPARRKEAFGDLLPFRPRRAAGAGSERPLRSVPPPARGFGRELGGAPRRRPAGCARAAPVRVDTVRGLLARRICRTGPGGRGGPPEQARDHRGECRLVILDVLEALDR